MKMDLPLESFKKNQCRFLMKIISKTDFYLIIIKVEGRGRIFNLKLFFFRCRLTISLCLLHTGKLVASTFRWKNKIVLCYDRT